MTAPAPDTAPAPTDGPQEGDPVSITGTDLTGVVTSSDGTTVTVEVQVDISQVEPVDTPPADDSSGPVLASAKDLALLRATRAEQILTRVRK